MNTTELLRRIVENAFDFLARSIAELNDYPKYSIIHFHAAVELFLKARLLSDHWSLVVAPSQKPDWSKFNAGNFRSVSLDEAAEKLDKVCQDGIAGPELAAFREITRHRNKTVHFFHDADYTSPRKRLRQKIAKEQLRAGFFLHRLLKEQWQDVFAPWTEQIDDAYEKLKAHRAFLQVIFDEKSDEIENRKKRGDSFCECPVCRFETQEYSNALDQIGTARCLVCDFTENYFMIECTECGNIVKFASEGFATCASCDKSYEPSDLTDHVIDEHAAYAAAKDGDDSYELGNCGDCGGHHTVARTKDDDYVCTSCLERFEYVTKCAWCNEANTGDMDGSYLSGCISCDGLIGHERDD